MSFTRYQTVFDLCQKIRVILGKGDNQYKSEDLLKYVEAYITLATSANKKKELNKKKRNPAEDYNACDGLIDHFADFKQED